MKHIVESQQFDRAFINEIFSIADSFQNSTNIGTPLAGKIMASQFYEPSTRTRFSFESAMMRLGGNVITTENAREFSSASKGETLEDSIRVIDDYADVIVLRHYEQGASARAAAVSDVPVINAGDGIGQHPTQALLDLYTIQKEHGNIDGLSIALVGDLKHGRTIRSLAYLLGKYENIIIYFVSIPALQIADDIKIYLKKHGVAFHEMSDLHSVIGNVDVVYQTRIQKERFASEADYEKCRGNFHINLDIVAKMKPDAIIMHPLPRIDEIATEVDAAPQAVYFKQAKYGVLVRMALLMWVLKK